MAFTLYSLLQAALLCVNAIAVLHEERFLKNSESPRGSGCGAADSSPTTCRTSGSGPAAAEGAARVRGRLPGRVPLTRLSSTAS